MRNGRRAVVSCFVSPGTGFEGRDAMIPSAPRPTKKMLGWPWTHISFSQDPDVCWILLGLFDWNTFDWTQYDAVVLRSWSLPCVCEYVTSEIRRLQQESLERREKELKLIDVRALGSCIGFGDTWTLVTKHTSYFNILGIDIKTISNYENYFVYLCLLIFDQEKCLREY